MAKTFLYFFLNVLIYILISDLVSIIYDSTNSLMFFKGKLMPEIIPIQGLLDSQLGIVIGNQDYIDLKADLEFLQMVIKHCEFEKLLSDIYIKQYEDLKIKLDAKKIIKIQQKAFLTIRVGLLHKHLGGSLDDFCRSIALSPLFQNFLGINILFGAKIPSRTTINELENSMPKDFLDNANTTFMSLLMDDGASKKFGFHQKFDMLNLYYDATCMKANIHYPVDYVFFKDWLRTTMLLLGSIRSKGVKIKMNTDPEKYESLINAFCMAMSAVHGKKGAKTKKKKIFRKMRELLLNGLGHANSHFIAFQAVCEKNGAIAKDLQILSDLKDMIEFAPKVIDLAKRRIVDEEIVPNEDKFFSLYEKEIIIIKRHKAGAENEFGNSAYLFEQKDGFILTADLLEKSSPGDAKLLVAGLEEIIKKYGNPTIESICGDRGCDSKEVGKLLVKIKETLGLDILNAVASKNVRKLIEQLKNKDIALHLKRRGSTEARIAIVKGITGNPMLQKGIANRRTHFAWAILTHNIFKAARMLRLQDLAKVA